MNRSKCEKLDVQGQQRTLMLAICVTCKATVAYSTLRSSYPLTAPFRLVTHTFSGAPNSADLRLQYPFQNSWRSKCGPSSISNESTSRATVSRSSCRAKFLAGQMNGPVLDTSAQYCGRNVLVHASGEGQKHCPVQNRPRP